MGVKPVFNVSEVETKISKKKPKWIVFCVLIVVTVSYTHLTLPTIA